MSDLLTSVLSKTPNAVTDAGPGVAVLSFAGEPSFPIAFKGQLSTDHVYLAGAGALNGVAENTQTDRAPSLAAIDVFSTQALCLAWKVAGQNTVKVMQHAVGEDGFPTIGGGWAPLPVATGRSANPAAQTDASPTLAIGANAQLYMAWKMPGTSGPIAWSVYNGQGWSHPVTIPEAVTDSAPALAGWDTSNVLPLCMAWKEAGGDAVFWSSFTADASGFTSNQVPGASTDVAPALTPGPVGEGAAYYLAWKDKGADTVFFASVKGAATGQIFTLPQAKTKHRPAIGNWSNNSSDGGAEVFNTLIVAFVGQSHGDVWQGTWSVIPDPAAGPSGGLSSASNYILCSGDTCAVLTHVVVTITVSEPLAYSRGYSFQLNCNTPTSATNYNKCNWQQCGWQVDSTGRLQYWVNNYTKTDGNSINTPYDNAHTTTTLNSSTLPAGFVLTITLDFDGNDNLVASTFGATDETGHTFPSARVDYVGLPLMTNDAKPGDKVTNQYIAPISTLQMDIVGFDNREKATFKSGAGSITYSAKQKLTAKGSIPSCADQTTTGESSNIVYGALPSAASLSQSQLFDVA